MGYSINMEYSPSEIVYLGKDRVKIDGIHIDSEGLRYHVKPVDKRWNTVFKVKEEHLSKEPQIEVKFICDNCGKSVPDEEIYHKYHGCCSGECEKKIIDKRNSIINDMYNQEEKDINNAVRKLKEYLDKTPTIIPDINAREDFFSDVTEEDIKKVAEVLAKNSLRFF